MRPEPRKKDTPEQFKMAEWVKEAGFGSILEQDIEPYVVDAIDNIFGSMVRGLIKGLKSDNK